MRDTDALQQLAQLSPAKQTLLALDLKERLDALEARRHEPIAVVGVGCRLPGDVESPEQLWALLDGRIDAIRETPADRWLNGDYYDPDPEAPGKLATRWGGFLRQVQQFDAAFFGISAREAAAMDPQQRVLLEVAWEALERAGQRLDALRGSRTGVYIGLIHTEYLQLLLRHLEPAVLDAYCGTGNTLSVAAGRIAFALGLRGPAVAVDTACSSSLMAIHLACRALRGGECDMALAGGVNLLLAPESTLLASRARMMAPDGRCKAFDARADGFVRGEGCGVVVLKTLSRALADADPIAALIKGTAANHDGASSGLTVPNGAAQREVIRSALQDARLSAETIDYVEAHGTGTALGDPIEANALMEVFAAGARKNPLAVGSIKTNIGHLEAAAGVAGLLKVIVSLARQELPAQLHFARLNEQIEPRRLDDGRPLLEVTASARPWPAGERPRRAGVSSFGVSGTNVHVIVEEPPVRAVDTKWSKPQPDVRQRPSPRLLPLSAKSVEALRAGALRLRESLSAALARDGQHERLFADLCHSAVRRRTAFRHRAVIAFERGDELIAGLDACAAGETAPGCASGALSGAPGEHLVFVFSGQGTARVGMAQALMAAEPRFERSLELWSELFAVELGWSLIDALRSSNEAADWARTDRAQPATFAIQMAYVELLQHWGVLPTAVAGHSLGEVAAATVAGVLTRDDAVKLVNARGRLMQQLHGRGAMLAAALTEAEALAYVSSGRGAAAEALDLAAVNGPRAVVFSGSTAAIAALQSTLRARQVRCRDLGVPFAFHSRQMDVLAAPLRESLVGLAPRAARLPFVSSTDLGAVRGVELDADYWLRNLRQAVRWSDAVARLLELNASAFLEIGPSTALVGHIRELAKATRREVVAQSCAPRGQLSEAQALTAALGALHCAGVSLPWERWTADGGPVPLPTYAWQRQRHWLPAIPRPADRAHELNAPGSELVPGKFFPDDRTAIHPMNPGGGGAAVSWRGRLRRDAVFVAEHRLNGISIVPATGQLELVRSAAVALIGCPAVSVHEVSFARALWFSDELEHVDLEIRFAPAEGPETLGFELRSSSGDAVATHATGTVRPSPLVGAGTPGTADLELLQDRCGDARAGASHYDQMEALGWEYGPSFRSVASVAPGDGEVVAHLQLNALAAGELARRNRSELAPAWLDACIQPLTALQSSDDMAGGTYLPVGLERFQVLGPLEALAYSHARLRPRTDPHADHPPSEQIADIVGYGRSGQPLVELRGLRARRAAPQTLRDRGQLGSPETAALHIASGVTEGQAFLELVRAEVGAAVGQRADDVPVSASLTDLGVDSLMGMDLKARLEARVGVSLPVVDLISGPTISQLAARIAERAAAQRCSRGVADPAETADSAADERAAAPPLHEPPMRVEPLRRTARAWAARAPSVQRFTSSDGLEICGHLSLPDRPLPVPAVVVMTSGFGGALNDAGEYVQLGEHAPLCERGFAVMTVDHRGALGHGDAFRQQYDFGGKEVDDAIAAARHLASLPAIESARIALLGTSRGAYAGLLALGRAPELWSAGVLCMGPFDPIRFAEQQRRSRPESSPFVVQSGKPWREILRQAAEPERGPLHWLPHVTAPMLVVHGGADEMVGPEHAWLLKGAASALGKDVELELVAEMNHDVEHQHPAWPELWQRIGAFLERAADRTAAAEEAA